MNDDYDDPAAMCPECAGLSRFCEHGRETHTSQETQEPTPSLTSGSNTSNTSNGSNTGEQSAEDEERQKVEDTALLAGVRDGAWLDKTNFPPLRYAVPGLIPEGLTLIVGPPKAGKSWLLANLLLALAAGGHAIGAIKIHAAKRVLYLALEDGDRRMKSRCQIIVGADEQIPGLYHYVTTIPPGKVVRVMEAWLRRYPDTAMIVLDTLGKVMPPALNGETSYQRDYRVGSALKAIADQHPGLSVVVIHHDRKAASEDFVDAVSGTNGLAGSADTIMVLARKRKSSDALLMVTGRDVPEDHYALKLVDGVHWVLDGADLGEAAKNAERREETQNLSDTSTQIIEFIREKYRPVQAKEVTDKFGEPAAMYLKRHLEAGRLVKEKRGWYAIPQAALDQP